MPDVPEKLVVIIPCFNEEHSLENTVASVREVASELPLEVTLMIIDDGSTDGTRRLLERLATAQDIDPVYNPRNLGVGRSLLNAYKTLPDGTWVTIMPGDNEVDFSSIKDFLEVRHQYDVILGYLKNPIIRPLGRRLLSVGYMRVVRTLYGFSYRYLNGMKLFRVEVFKGIDVRAAGHAFNSELLAKALLRDPTLRVGEVAFLARGRTTGTSKAIRPRAVVQALAEVASGFRRVNRYRKKIIQGD